MPCRSHAAQAPTTRSTAESENMCFICDSPCHPPAAQGGRRARMRAWAQGARVAEPASAVRALRGVQSMHAPGTRGICCAPQKLWRAPRWQQQRPATRSTAPKDGARRKSAPTAQGGASGRPRPKQPEERGRGHSQLFYRRRRTLGSLYATHPNPKHKNSACSHKPSPPFLLPGTPTGGY